MASQVGALTFGFVKLASSDLEKFNAQYPTLEIRTSMAFHDRFLIIDDKELYLIGASLKDLGKKCFRRRTRLWRTSWLHEDGCWRNPAAQGEGL